MSLELNGTTGVQGNSGAFVAGTAVASTSGTSIDFTGIPSWVKRVTVMFKALSTNGSSIIQIQLGAGSVATSGYVSYATYQGGATQAGGATSTTGFILDATNSSGALRSGHAVFTLLGSNAWVGSVNNGSVSSPPFYYSSTGGGDITLGGTLDRVRITTVNGTDTFDAGSINILYE